MLLLTRAAKVGPATHTQACSVGLASRIHTEEDACAIKPAHFYLSVHQQQNLKIANKTENIFSL